MEVKSVFTVTILWINIFLTKVLCDKQKSGLSSPAPCPSECDLKKCASLSYCKDKIGKDHCGCCPKCSSDVWVHPKFSSVKKGGACEEVRCPRLKVCMENIQGLPLCTCPNFFICRRRKKEVCGVDGTTYQSRCHLRVVSCIGGKRIKIKHKGPCNNGMVATQQHGSRRKYPLSEYDIKKRRRRNRKQEKLKRKRERRRRKRRHRKRSYARGRKQKVKTFNKKQRNRKNRKDSRKNSKKDPKLQ